MKTLKDGWNRIESTMLPNLTKAGYSPTHMALLYDVFYAGASAFHDSLGDAAKTGEPGALLKTFSSLQDELEAFSQSPIEQEHEEFQRKIDEMKFKQITDNILKNDGSDV